MGLREDQLGAGEHIVLNLRTHWKAVVQPVTFAVFLVAALWVLWWWLGDSPGGGWPEAAAVVVALVVAVVFVVLPLWRWYSERFVVTNRRIAHRRGILTRTGRDIPLRRVNDIAIERDVLDRILGCGTLIVSDATEKPGLVLHDIPDVERVQVRLQDLLHGEEGS